MNLQQNLRPTNFFLFILVIAILQGFMGCNSEGDLEGTTGTGHLRVHATDDPFPFDDVARATLTVSRIEARNSNGEYVTLSAAVSTFDLVQLRNGLTRILADQDIPAGSYDQIRLIIEDAGVILTNGNHYDLTVPSGAHSGLKVFISPPIQVGTDETKDMLLDFDLARSFVPQGNPINGFHFNPVVRATSFEGAGTIAGQAFSNNGTAANLLDDTALSGVQVSATLSGISIATAGTDVNGNYQLLGVPPGTYEVVFSKEGFATTVAHGVVVTAGAATAANEILVVIP